MKNDDAELIQRVLDGDDTAFSALVKKHQKPVHALAWRKTGDFHVAEEITQDTFLKAYQNLSTLKEPQKFAGWLYVIATNYCKMWLRKKRLSTQSLEATSSAELEKTAYSGYVIAENEQVAMETQREVVKKLLAKLQESDRTVITLYYLGEMSYEEISEFLGVSVAAIKNRLYRARNRLKKEESMIREALENFQITPNLTETIMQEISRLKPAAPSGSKPFVPWAIGVSAVAIMLLMLGFSNQYLSRFQKPYSFNAASEMKVELIDAPVVRNLETEPDDRTQLGNANVQGENNGTNDQANNAAPLDLETIITRMKHHHNAVTSGSGDFVMEQHSGPEIEKDEYSLTFKGKKVRIEWEKPSAVNVPFVEYWDGKQQWAVNRPRNLIFTVDIAPNKESTVLEKIQHGFKQVGIEITDDVHIVAGDLPNSFKINENDKIYVVLFVGETTLEVYDGNVVYTVGQQINYNDFDPRYWLTHPKLGSDDSYLSEPLWQVLEKHESELIDSEVLNGEMTSVIRLNRPSRTNASLKLWISHNIGFRLVKSENIFTGPNGVTYISTREIDYHEYLPNLWFPKRIENMLVTEELPEQQRGANFIFKSVLLTKRCQLNTDVSELLRLRISTDTSVWDTEVNHFRSVGDLEVKPNFQTQRSSPDAPSQNTGSEQHVNNSTPPDSLQWHLPEGAKARLGKGRIDEIEYSPDGTLLAVASSIGTWIHDAATGQEIDLLTKHTGRVLCVAFSPDGKTLASGNADNTIRLWDTQSRTHLKTLNGHTDTVLGVVFSADGTTLASGSSDNTLRLWDAQTGELQKTLKGHTNGVLSVVFGPNGKTLASGGKDNTLRLWDVQTGTLQKTLDLIEHTEEILRMAFSPDGKTLASWDFGWDVPIRLWDVQTGEVQKTLKGEERDGVEDMAFSPDGKTLASAMDNGTLRLWDVQTGKRHRILTGHKDLVFSVAFSPDGKTLTSGGRDGTLRLWDRETGECRNTRTGYTSEVMSVAFSPDGKTLASAMGDETVGLWDAQTGILHWLLNIQPRTHTIESMTFSPDGKVLAGGGSHYVVHLWNAETGERQKTLGAHDIVTSVAFSPDGRILASASRDKAVRLWDTQTGELRNTLSGHTDWVNSVAFSPDGTTLASASNDTTIHLWDTQTGELRRTFTGHEDVINSVAFSPDGKVLASGSGNIYTRHTSGSQGKTIRLWDVETGTIHRTFPAQKDEVLRVAFSPDGKVLAASQDKIIQLWDVQTHTVRRTLEGHTSWVWSVAFSPDGRTLVSGSGDGTLLLWEITPHTAD